MVFTNHEIFYLVSMKTTSSTTTSQTTFPGPSRDFSDFLEALKKYTIPDIEKLQQVAFEHEKQGLNDGGRCTTALAKLCFAVVGCCDYLFSGTI